MIDFCGYCLKEAKSYVMMSSPSVSNNRKAKTQSARVNKSRVIILENRSCSVPHGLLRKFGRIFFL